MKITNRNFLKKYLWPASLGAIAAGLILAGIGLAQPGQSPNFAWLRGAALGSEPAMVCQGLDANVDCDIRPQGTGTLKVNGVPVTVGTSPIFTGLVTQQGGEVSTLGVTSGITATLKASPSRIFHAINDAPTTGTIQQTLYTYTVPAATLASDGQSLRVVLHARTAANANNKTLTITFGATTIYNSSAQAFNNSDAIVTCDVFRTGAATQKARCQSQFPPDNSAVAGGSVTFIANATVPAETLSGAIVMNVTATTPTASGDLTASAMSIDWYPQGQ